MTPNPLNSFFLVLVRSKFLLIRNILSIGIDLEADIQNGFLEKYASRPTFFWAGRRLVAIHKKIKKFKPKQ